MKKLLKIAGVVLLTTCLPVIPIGYLTYKAYQKFSGPKRKAILSLLGVVLLLTGVYSAAFVKAVTLPSPSQTSSQQASQSQAKYAGSKTGDVNMAGAESASIKLSSPSPSSSKTPSPSPSQNPTPTPTYTPEVIYTPEPTPAYTPETQQTQPASQTNSSSYVCDCSKTCTEISSCAEAQFQLNQCGCTRRDADHDGIACDNAPLHCEN